MIRQGARRIASLPDSKIMEICREMYDNSLACMIAQLSERVKLPGLDPRTRARIGADLESAQRLLKEALSICGDGQRPIVRPDKVYKMMENRTRWSGIKKPTR